MRYSNLINSASKNDKEEIEVVAGGQAGLFEKRFVVDFDTAKAALVFYIQDEETDPSLTWEEDV